MAIKLNFSDYKSVIFDADGTLLNSMPIWTSVASDYLLSRGRIPRPGLNEELRALGGHEIPYYFQSEYDLRESAGTILGGINNLLEFFYFNIAPLKAGALDVLEFFRRNGAKMCIATATDRSLIEPALKRCGVLDFVERIYTCSEEATNKRSPDIYIRAAGFLDAPVEKTLVFEDALYAIKTAKNAGFPVVAIYDDDACDQCDEIESLCDCYIRSWEDLLVLLGNRI